MVLGRIIRAFDAEHLSSIRTKWLTAIFVINDVICFLTQIVGAGVQVTGDQQLMSIGMKAVLGGLIFILIVFCLFVLVAVVFHRRLARNPTPVVRRNPELAWRRYMWAIYISCLTMIVRNLVRTIEFGASKGSAVNTQEAYIYVFDAAMMAISMAVVVVWHPGRLIRRLRKEDKYTPMADVPLTRYDSPPRP